MILTALAKAPRSRFQSAHGDGVRRLVHAAASLPPDQWRPLSTRGGAADLGHRKSASRRRTHAAVAVGGAHAAVGAVAVGRGRAAAVGLSPSAAAPPTVPATPPTEARRAGPGSSSARSRSSPSRSA